MTQGHGLCNFKLKATTTSSFQFPKLFRGQRIDNFEQDWTLKMVRAVSSLARDIIIQKSWRKLKNPAANGWEFFLRVPLQFFMFVNRL